MQKTKHLPGDPSHQQKIARIIRVNHAGEYGAKRIYEGQLAVLKDKTIEHMRDQELEHLDYFAKALNQRHVRPTMLHPIWHVAGFALGAGTALLGRKAAMACTIAVEEVIEGHYQRQLDTLGEDEAELKEAISKFRDEELEHRDIGIREEGEETPGYKMLSGAIKTASRTAIWIAERF